VKCPKATDGGSCNKYNDSRKAELTVKPQPVRPSEDKREYYCFKCQTSVIGQHCDCGAMCFNLLSETRTAEVVIPVKFKVTFRKGSLKALKAKMVPTHEQRGWDRDLGEFHITPMGVADGTGE
jgi:hypothetical protein